LFKRQISGKSPTVSVGDKVCPTVALNHLHKNTSGCSRGCLRATDTTVVPKRNRVLLRHVKGALDNRFGFSGQGMARRSRRNTPCGSQVSTPPTSATRFRSQPFLARRFVRTRLPGRTSVSYGFRLSRRCFASERGCAEGMRAKPAVQLAKETLLDETETGFWSAHVMHELGRPELWVRVTRPHARVRRLWQRLLLSATVLRENLLCRRARLWL
jgi:hypothetical protein